MCKWCALGAREGKCGCCINVSICIPLPHLYTYASNCYCALAVNLKPFVGAPHLRESTDLKNEFRRWAKLLFCVCILLLFSHSIVTCLLFNLYSFCRFVLTLGPFTFIKENTENLTKNSESANKFTI